MLPNDFLLMDFSKFSCFVLKKRTLTKKDAHGLYAIQSVYVEIISRKNKYNSFFLQFNFFDAQIKFCFTKNIDENINLWINKNKILHLLRIGPRAKKMNGHTIGQIKLLHCQRFVIQTQTIDKSKTLKAISTSTCYKLNSSKETIIRWQSIGEYDTL